jgi:hypothetical protein
VQERNSESCNAESKEIQPIHQNAIAKHDSKAIETYAVIYDKTSEGASSGFHLLSAVWIGRDYLCGTHTSD